MLVQDVELFLVKSWGGLGRWSETGTAEVLVPSPSVVLDVTEGFSPKWLTGSLAVGPAVRFSVVTGRRNLVVEANGLLSPRIVHPAPSTLRDGRSQADYLLVAPEAFLGAAEPLLLRRASEGLVVKAVSLEEIATVFGHGQASGESIRAFVGHAYHAWAKPSPRYVVLLGDATHDPRRFSSSTTLGSPLPALWGKTSYLWTALDPALGAVNGEDEVPDVAVGRIPAGTVEQARSLIGKIQFRDEHKLGVYKKARLGNTFRWELEELGYSKKFVEVATEGLIVYITRK